MGRPARTLPGSGTMAMWLLVIIVPPAASATVVYVDSRNGAGQQDGASWATAYGTVQQGIEAAADAGGGEVWVATGTYKPTPTTDRAVSFELAPGVALYGGFDGTETEREQRDWTSRATVLSGDIGVPGESGDNCYHVVRGGNNALLDGFTITGGNADGDTYDGKGGGMVNYTDLRGAGGAALRGRPPGPGVLGGTGFSPTVANCIFTGNYAREGGAMYNFDAACPTLAHCTFTGNSADKGGALVNRMASNCTVTDCTFTENHARWRGGAVFNDYGASARFANCTFSGNSTDGHGGGIYTDDTSSQIGHTSPAIERCTFTGNRAAFRGGAIALYNRCTPTVTGCTFTGNHAGQGGGAISLDYRVTAVVEGCTFVDNTTDEGEPGIDVDQSSVVLN